METENVVIIGAGPAGLAAAKQLKLYEIDPLVYECDEPGGLLLNACSVVNYPGVAEGISGKDLIRLFGLPDRIAFRKVTKVCRKNDTYQVHASDHMVKTRTVIIATGTVPRKIHIPNVPDNRIHYEIKKLANNSGGSVAIIGGGDAALDYAISLSSGYTVNVYARGNFSKAVPHLWRKVCNIGNITLYPESLPRDFFSEDKVVVAVGRTAKVDFISKKLLSSPPADNSFHMCGDCRNGIYRQTAIAVGNGIEAAMKTADYLKMEIQK